MVSRADAGLLRFNATFSSNLAAALWLGFFLDAFRCVQRETAALLTRDLRNGYAAPVLRSTTRWLTENRSRKAWLRIPVIINGQTVPS